MKSPFVLPLACCLWAGSTAVQAVDVFLTADYVNALTGSPPCATSATATSTVAAKDDRPNCIWSMSSYFLEGACYPRVSTAWSGFGSGKYFALNETHYCRQGFTDQACQTPFDENESCNTLYATGYDASEDRERFIHRDMCMATATPQGAFTVPVVETRLYEDKTACEAREYSNNNDTPYLSQRLLMDPETCMPGATRLQDRDDDMSPAAADGGFVTYCQEMNRRAIVYANKECTSQSATPPLAVPEFVVTACTQTTREDSTVNFYSDCGRSNDITHHCKSFPSVGFGVDMGTSNPGGNPTMAPSGAVGMVQAGGIMMIGLLASAVALVA